MNPETFDTETTSFDLQRLCQYFSERSTQPMVAVAGTTHLIHYHNPAFARLAGKSSAVLTHQPIADAVPEASINGLVSLLDRVLATGLPENLDEHVHQRTPSVYWSYAAWAILGDDERPVGVMIHVTDSTEAAVFRRQARQMNEALVISSVRQHELVEEIRKAERERQELEAKMFQAQKMESLGTLAGGIAHDLNNILTPVIGYTDLAMNTLPPDSPATDLLQEVGTNARRAADLVQQILAYAGKGRFVIEPVDLSRLVHEMGGLLRGAVSKQVELRFDLASDLPPTEGDVTQLRQVVMNLVINASEALGDKGGTIAVRTGGGKAHHPVPPLSKTNPASGSHVFLEVSDTGCGMSLDVVDKIYDPFFTTKFTGRGLGLAVVQGVVRGHGGSLEVRTELGRGTTFNVSLLASTKAVPAPTAVRQFEGWRGTGTVLVIDDESGIRKMLGSILGAAGLKVLTASHGEEGLRTFRETMRIDVVVMDMTMPGMSGLEIAAELRGLRPGLPIILVSGYSVEEAILLSLGGRAMRFLKKPFRPVDIVATVRHELDR